jgi:cytochrome c6
MCRRLFGVRRRRYALPAHSKQRDLRKGGSLNLSLKRTLVYIAATAFLGAVSVLAISASRKVSAAGDARSVYNTRCASCHGRDGRAASAHARREHARDMTSGEWQDSVSDERIYNSISNGKGKMPAFKKKLTDAQIDELVNYVRRLRR